MTAPSASARTWSSTETGSDVSSAHATVPPLRHARTARAAAVRSPSTPGSSATTASGAAAAYTIATGSASATARSGAPSADARCPAAAATRSAPTAYGSLAVSSTCIVLGRTSDGWTSPVNSHTLIGGTMKWVKPNFEILELCSEVTSYVYHR